MKNYKPRHTIKKIYTDTYAISDSGIGQGKVFMYLLAGSEKSLLIDSGFGLLDLKAITSSITDKEVICVCTHGHVDHALGACQYENAYLHSKDFDVYKRHTDPRMITDMGMKGLLMKPPASMLRNSSYVQLVEKLADTPHRQLKPLDDIKEFDLGDRIISWYPVPGHTQGSAAFIDEKNKTSFDADAAPVGAWLFLSESSPLPEYIESLENYYDFLFGKGITHHYLGHAGTPLKIKSIKNLIRCSRLAIKKPNKGAKVNSMFGPARIIFAEGALMFCSAK
ncbi:MAG: MBL fold metallo-hydrolase [Treponema sp.]|nr:MBL fold metallo-hydrolase [Treponema sp.]